MFNRFDGPSIFRAALRQWRAAALLPHLAAILLCVTGFSCAHAQPAPLRTRIDSIVAGFDGKVGISVLPLDSHDTLTHLGQAHFPMQSVYKFPLALYVLHLVDSGVLSLDQKIALKKSDLLPNTWSPLREKYPHGKVDVSLREIIRFTVSQSDNNGCDILFRLVGGPKQVERWIHSRVEVKDIAIVATEEEMHKKWNVQYTNWCTPLAMTRLLALFHTGQVLSAESRAFLWSCMVETTTGPRRIKGQLPEKTVVAHKTGTSGTRKGVTAAINDAGIIVLPNDRRVAVVVFVAETRRTDAEAERIIATVARAVWEAYAEE